MLFRLAELLYNAITSTDILNTMLSGYHSAASMLSTRDMPIAYLINLVFIVIIIVNIVDRRARLPGY